MTRIVQGSTLILTGDVGDLDDGEDHFTLDDARSGLAQIGRQRATVRLNSGGGDASVGIAVASLFSAHPGGVEVIVEGVAASAASAAACGGARVVMALGAVWMLDEARAVTLGTAEDHEAAVAGLDAINSSLASVYAHKTGGTPQAMAALMAAETWMTADDAVVAGFADAVLGQGAVEPAAFAYSARSSTRRPHCSTVGSGRRRGRRPSPRPCSTPSHSTPPRWPSCVSRRNSRR